MASKDQTFLLNLMETGMVTETKHRKTRAITNVKTWVFATSNNVSKVMLPLQSRFLVVNLEPYTYEQFYQITVVLLTKQPFIEIDKPDDGMLFETCIFQHK
jgi:hypothetical protein